MVITEQHSAECWARHAQIFHSAWIFSIHTINFCITLIASCTPAGTEIGDSSQFSHRFAAARKNANCYSMSPVFCIQFLRFDKFIIMIYKKKMSTNQLHAITEMQLSVYLHEGQREAEVHFHCRSRGRKSMASPAWAPIIFTVVTLSSNARSLLIRLPTKKCAGLLVVVILYHN